MTNKKRADHYPRTVVDEPEEKEEKEDEEFDLTLDTLSQPESIGYLGVLAANLLNSTGCANFVVDEDGSIVLVNPTRVFFDSSVLIPPRGKVPKLVRPVLMDGRPAQVAIKEDGSIWEVEYVDEEEMENE